MPPIDPGYTDEERALFAAGGTPLEEPASPTPAPAPLEEPTSPTPAPVTTAVPVSPAIPRGDPAAGGQAPVAADDPSRPRMVPHEALHAERVRANEALRNTALATARLNRVLEERRAAAGVEAPAPTLEEDPEGYIRNLEQRLQRFESINHEEAEQRRTDTSLEADEASFRAYTPDYDAASNHYVQSRARELLLTYAPEEAKRIMTTEVRQIAQTSWQRGVPAAQTIYALAQARGYTPGAAPAPVAGAPGAAPSPAPAPTAGGPAAAAVVASALAGQAASHSLSGGTGSGGAQALNAEALLALSDEEFEKYMALGTKGANSKFAEIAGR